MLIEKLYALTDHSLLKTYSSPHNIRTNFPLVIKPHRRETPSSVSLVDSTVIKLFLQGPRVRSLFVSDFNLAECRTDRQA